MDIGTGAIKKVLEKTVEGSTDINDFGDRRLLLLQVYHLSRCSDALERIAAMLEDGQIALLEGPDINNRLSEIKMVLQNK